MINLIDFFILIWYYDKNDCCYSYHYVFPKYSMLKGVLDIQQNNKACSEGSVCEIIIPYLEQFGYMF